MTFRYDNQCRRRVAWRILNYRGGMAGWRRRPWLNLRLAWPALNGSLGVVNTRYFVRRTANRGVTPAVSC